MVENVETYRDNNTLWLAKKHFQSEQLFPQKPQIIILPFPMRNMMFSELYNC